MLLKREGVPTEEELVLCTVTSVQYHSVFVTLDEFGGKTGMIHISEVAPGRIRNIREFVNEGKKVVCKVLSLSPDNEKIDLSLRRVNEKEKRDKLDQIRREQQAEKILQVFAIQKKLKLEDVYAEIKKVLMSKSSKDRFIFLFDLFDEVVNNGFDLAKAGLGADVAKGLTDLVKARIKPPEVQVTGELKLESYAANGVELVKQLILQLLKENIGLAMSYLGGGSFSMKVTSNDYRSAEKILKKASEDAMAIGKKAKVTITFTRDHA